MTNEHIMHKLVNQRAVQLLALVIWKLRRYLPGLRVEITHAEMKEFNGAFRIQQPQVTALDEGDKVVLALVDQRGGALLLKHTESSVTMPDYAGIAAELRELNERDSFERCCGYNALLERAASALEAKP